MKKHDLMKMHYFDNLTQVSCIIKKHVLMCCRYLRHRRDKQGANFTYEIIIVDDGSVDNTSG